MMFFSDVDTAGHTCGFDPAAPGYLDAIAVTDAQIGQVMTAMAARPNFANEDWLVILTTDHGGLGTGHSGGLPPQRTIPFIVAGPLATTVLPQAHPRQVDVAATVLTYFGAPIPSNYDGHAVGLTPPGPLPPCSARTSSSTATPNTTADSTQAARSNTPRAGTIRARAASRCFAIGAAGGFPTVADPAPPTRGDNFFSGGMNATSTMTQRIDVSNLAGLIAPGPD